MNLEQRRFGGPGGLFLGPPDLAHIEQFDLGGVGIVPAERRLVALDGGDVKLEPLVMQVLVALAHAGGRTLSRDDLVSECWGRRIVGDDAVNRVMSRLRRSLDAASDGRLRVETVSKVGYRLKVEDNGGGEAGAQSAPDAAPDALPVADRFRPRARLAAAAAAVLGAIGLGAAAMLVGSPAGGVAIAIEPAAGSSADARTAAFASDLTTDIAQLTGSMTRLTLVEPDAPTTADMTLQVAFRDDGAGEGAGARLVDTADGAVVWSRAFDTRNTPEAVVRERAAHAIAGVVRCGLDRSAGDLGDPVSKRLYFSACDAVQMRDWPRAQSFAQQIVERRPDSAASWACLAMTTAHAGEGSPANRQKAAREAMEYARRAIRMDPRSGLAHQSLAVALEMQGMFGFPAIEKGVKMDPEHSGLLARYAFGLFDLGYLSASAEPALRAVALDPGDYGMAMTAFSVLVGTGRYAEANELKSKIERIWGADRKVGTSAVMAFYDADPQAGLTAYDASPLNDKATSEVARAELVWRTNPAGFDWNGFDAMAGRLYRQDSSMAWKLAFGASRMKDMARAHLWLERSHATIADTDWYLLFWPDAAELRRDPRFFAKMAEVGLVAEWRRRNRWPDFCSDPGLRYDCRREAARLAATARS